MALIEEFKNFVLDQLQGIGDFERIHNIEDKRLFIAIKERRSLSIVLSNLDFLEN